VPASSDGHTDGRGAAGEGLAVRVASLLVAWAALFAACSKQDAAKPRLSCDVAVKQGVAAVIERAQVVVTRGEMTAEQHAQLAERSEKLAQLAPRLEAILASRCIDERWPQATVECVVNVKSVDELRACRVALPPEADLLSAR
jgi:hypothetical protein